MLRCKREEQLFVMVALYIVSELYKEGIQKLAKVIVIDETLPLESSTILTTHFWDYLS